MKTPKNSILDHRHHDLVIIRDRDLLNRSLSLYNRDRDLPAYREKNVSSSSRSQIATPLLKNSENPEIPIVHPDRNLPSTQTTIYTRKTHFLGFVKPKQSPKLKSKPRFLTRTQSILLRNKHTPIPSIKPQLECQEITRSQPQNLKPVTPKNPKQNSDLNNNGGYLDP